MKKLPAPSSGDAGGLEAPLWRRLHLLWRLHFGMPATVGLAVLVVCLPLLSSAWDDLAETRDLPRRFSPRSGQPVTNPAFTSLDRMAPPVAPGASGDLPQGAVLTRPPAEALLLEVLPLSGQRGADLGYLIAAARNAGLGVVQTDYGLETSRLPGLARLRVDLALRGNDAQLQQLLTRLQDQFPNLAIDSIEWLPATAKQGRANIGIHLVQFYRVAPG